MILHQEVQPILDRFKGHTIERCLKLASNNYRYIESEAGKAESGDQWMAHRTIWEAVWGLFHGAMREFGMDYVW